MECRKSGRGRRREADGIRTEPTALGESLGKDTEIKEGWTVKGEGKPDTFRLRTAVVLDGSQEDEGSSELFAC